MARTDTDPTAMDAPKNRRRPNHPPAQTAVPQYRDGVAVEASNTAEMEAFAAFQSAHQGLAPASREVLRAWAASRNGKS